MNDCMICGKKCMGECCSRRTQQPTVTGIDKALED